VATDVKAHRRITRFVTEKQIARAGFNLGKFETAESSSAGVRIHSYAAKIVEQPLAAREARSGLHPDPAREVHQIAAQAASTVQFLSGELDPFPYPTGDYAVSRPAQPIVARPDLSLQHGIS
jgi:hypothetical protein